MPGPRHVGLNALFLDPGVSGGTETYLRALVPALARRFPDVRFTVATTRRGADALRRDGWEDLVGIEALPADEGRRVERLVAEQARLPVLARRRGWDVLHSLASVAPLRAGVPSVITVHDVTFFKLRTFGRVTTFGMQQIVARAARHADVLVAVSAAARDEICEVLDLSPGLFHVVPHGLGRRASAEAMPASEVRQRHDLGDSRVALCVAAKRPHKNQELLVRALAHLPADVAVVCAGHEEGYEVRLRELARELGVKERLRLPGYVPDAELEGLWGTAACAVFPTLAEGFGLPVLEAMDRGVPVACSDIPVLREVGGEPALYFDPHDPRAAAAAIQQAMGDTARARAGRARAAGYSWDAAAEQTFEAYERAFSRSRRAGRPSRAPAGSSRASGGRTPPS